MKPDGAAALTIFPAWTWLPLGLVPGLARLRKDRKGGVLLLAAWLGYGLAFSEEWRSLVRVGVDGGRAPNTIRVVTLNCGGGIPEAAKEVAAYRPDVVFLQESPGPDDVRRLARELFGAEGRMVKGPDASIIARAPLEPVPLPAATANRVVAKAVLLGQETTLVSLRLAPPALRVDLVMPDAWTQVAENRAARRAEIMEISRTLPGGSSIVGGDFNCQSGDRSLDAMPPDLRDAFYEAGRGWCHTAVNDYPLARIDQIWISPEWRARQLFVRKTVHSDHRMVVCDLERVP